MTKELTEQDYFLDQVAELNEDAIVLEPQSTFNRAIIGFDTNGVLIYSANKIIDALSKVDGMTTEEAIEFFEYNTLGTFRGMDNPNKPIFAYDEFIF
jgi:hypothetical protein